MVAWTVGARVSSTGFTESSFGCQGVLGCTGLSVFELRVVGQTAPRRSCEVLFFILCFRVRVLGFATVLQPGRP